MTTRESLYRINPNINIPKEMNLNSTVDEPLTKLETRLFENVKNRMMKGATIWSRRQVEPETDDCLDIGDIIGMINDTSTPEPIRSNIATPSAGGDNETFIETPRKTCVVQNNFRRLVSAISYSRGNTKIKKKTKNYTQISPSHRVKKMLETQRKQDKLLKEQITPVHDKDDAVVPEPVIEEDEFKVPLISYPGMEVDSETGKPSLSGLGKDIYSIIDSNDPVVDSRLRYRIEEATRRRAFRRLLFQDYTDKLTGIKEINICPMPAESWVRADVNKRAQDNACRLGTLNEEIQIEISQKRAEVIKLERNHEVGKSTKVTKRKSILGMASMAEWRKRSRQLKKDAIGGRRSTVSIDLNRACERYVLTAHQRTRMPLPTHLAYNTKTGCRNY